MTELKRCPFCGNDYMTTSVLMLPGINIISVKCVTCGIAVNPEVKWNTRPIEDELQARITELETELLNTMIIKYANEDEIPNMDDSVYDRMNSCSLVHGVKLFPYIEKHGKKYYLVDLENEQ